jgi:hypothetical protein
MSIDLDFEVLLVLKMLTSHEQRTSSLHRASLPVVCSLFFVVESEAGQCADRSHEVAWLSTRIY